MSQSSAAEALNGVACSHSSEPTQKSMKRLSVDHFDRSYPTPQALVRASPPSRYLRRKGLMPSSNALQVVLGDSKILCISSSSSTVSGSSKASSPIEVISSGPAVVQASPSLPNLTASNLALLISQLELSNESSALPSPRHIHSHFTLNPIEKSYFSSVSSVYSDLDSSVS